MAELTDRAPARDDASAVDGHDRDVAVPRPAAIARHDARAVRARIAATSARGDEPIMRLASGDEAGVSAQRQPEVDGALRDVELRRSADSRAILRDGDERIPIVVGPPRPGRDRTMAREIIVDGFRLDVEVIAERLAALRERATRAGASVGHGGPLEVRAIIPGKVVSVSVAAGDGVVAGQQLLVVEAMKMQNELRAPRDGTIDRVGIAPGVNIEVGDLLLVIS